MWQQSDSKTERNLTKQTEKIASGFARRLRDSNAMTLQRAFRCAVYYLPVMGHCFSASHRAQTQNALEFARSVKLIFFKNSLALLPLGPPSTTQPGA